MTDRFQRFVHRIIDAAGVPIHVWIGGQGEPLLLLHGYPETHMMWHRVVHRLAEHFTVVCPDLRGYGDSGRPEAGADHAGYSKRAMGADQFEVMTQLGFDRFLVMAHDRGARVCHQMLLDHPERIRRAILLDIMPTLDMYENLSMELATAYYHWFFLIQPYDIPERMIEADPGLIVNSFISRMSADEEAFPEDVVAHYIEKFSDPAVIHATCEDYRAAATIDLEHQREARLQPKFTVPTLVIWGTQSLRKYDMLGIWREKGAHVTGLLAEHCGHYIPEEDPALTLRAAEVFFGSENDVLTEEECDRILAG